MNTIELQQTLPAVFAGRDSIISDVWHQSLTLKRGEAYLVEAASGTGKSSLCSYVYGYRNDYQGIICFDGKKYSAYGITIGDSESHLLTKAEETKVLAGEGSTGYKYTYYFSMLDDIGQRGSTAEYFLGVDGSVLVLVINDTSNRVVNIIYYYDSTRILQDIDRIL